MRLPVSRSTAAALALSLGWFVYGVANLRFHGVTLDETSLFYSGDRTLYFFTHPFQKGVLDLPAPGEPAGFSTRFARFPDFQDPMHYPVFQDVVMAITNQIFSVGLGWFDDIDGHHFGLVLLHALGLFAFAWYAVRALGERAGLCATAIYALTPAIVGFAFNNPKDLLGTDLYGAAVLAGAAAFLHGRARDLWAFGVLVGLALSCKINGAFAGVTLFSWLLFVRHHFKTFGEQRLWKPLLYSPLVAFAVFFALWPWLWYGTPLDWIAHLLGYARHVMAFSHSERASPTLFPFIALWATTPPLVLLLLVVGLVSLFRPSSPLRLVRWLLVIWFTLPLVRTALPYSEFYDGNRHFMEYLSGLAALAGVGADAVLALLAQRAGGWKTAAVASVLGLWVLWLPIDEYRPYEGAYFNSLVGGLGGAQARALFFMLAPPHDSRESGSEGDFWASSLRGAMKVANEIMPAGAKLGMCGPSGPNTAADVNYPVHIRLTHWSDPGADYVFFMARECYCKRSDIRRYETERPVVARVERGGGLIYEILGPKTDYPLPPVSPHTRYEELPHYPH